MNITDIASENYYKFLALLGIFLILFSVTYYSNQGREINLDIEKINKDFKIVKSNVDDFKRQIDNGQKNRDLLHAHYKNLSEMRDIFKKYSNVPSEKFKLFNEITALNSDMLQLDERIDRQNEKLLESKRKVDEGFVELEYLQKVIEIKDNELDLWEIYLVVWILFGIFLAFIGLKKWKKSQDIYEEIMLMKLQIVKREHPELCSNKKEIKRKSQKLF